MEGKGNWEVYPCLGKGREGSGVHSTLIARCGHYVICDHYGAVRWQDNQKSWE